MNGERFHYADKSDMAHATSLDSEMILVPLLTLTGESGRSQKPGAFDSVSFP